MGIGVCLFVMKVEQAILMAAMNVNTVTVISSTILPPAVNIDQVPRHQSNHPGGEITTTISFSPSRYSSSWQSSHESDSSKVVGCLLGHCLRHEPDHPRGGYDLHYVVDFRHGGYFVKLIVQEGWKERRKTTGQIRGSKPGGGMTWAACMPMINALKNNNGYAGKECDDMESNCLSKANGTRSGRIEGGTFNFSPSLCYDI